jgi:hypothetical protein
MASKPNKDCKPPCKDGKEPSKDCSKQCSGKDAKGKDCSTQPQPCATGKNSKDAQKCAPCATTPKDAGKQPAPSAPAAPATAISPKPTIAAGQKDAPATVSASAAGSMNLKKLCFDQVDVKGKRVLIR